jgi:hypothetical protein
MKIKRNDPCPCGSGKKYKKCCSNAPVSEPASFPQDSAKNQEKVTLGKAIEEFQKLAAEKKQVVQQIGVFLFFADEKGDAWVLELTDADCIQIASAGSPLEVSLQEDDETIVIDWTHKYSFKNKSLQVKSYKGKKTLVLRDAPSQKLFAIRRKFLKKISPELLDQVHLDK